MARHSHSSLPGNRETGHCLKITVAAAAAVAVVVADTAADVDEASGILPGLARGLRGSRC